MRAHHSRLPTNAHVSIDNELAHTLRQFRRRVSLGAARQDSARRSGSSPKAISGGFIVAISHRIATTILIHPLSELAEQPNDEAEHDQHQDDYRQNASGALFQLPSAVRTVHRVDRNFLPAIRTWHQL